MNMLSLPRDNNQSQDHDDREEDVIREIHALTPPHPPSIPIRHHSSTSTHSMASGVSSENFTSISREFNALVLAGSNLESDRVNEDSLRRIREEIDDTNPLAIVLDNSNNNPAVEPVASPARGRASSTTTGPIVQSSIGNNQRELVSVQTVKREEVEAKILAWQNAKMAKVNNRFKREDAVISGWENEQLQKSSSWMKKVERRLEEKRAKATEKMENEVAKAHRKAEERRASAEAKRGTKVARILEVANLMRTVGRAPAKKSFF